MQTTGNGISFSLIKKTGEEESTAFNHKAEGKRGKKTENMQKDLFYANDESQKKDPSDQRKVKNRSSHKDLSSQNISASKGSGKGKNRASEPDLAASNIEDSSTSSTFGKSKSSQDDLKTPKFDRYKSHRNGKMTMRDDKISDNMVNSSNSAGKGSRKSSQDDLSTPKLNRSKPSRNSSAGLKDLSMERNKVPPAEEEHGGNSIKNLQLPMRPKNGSYRGDRITDGRQRKIRASRADGEITKEGARMFYKNHYSLQKVEQGLEAHTLLQGTLRINKRNRSESYVTVLGRDDDIFIQGVTARNRALNGDIVVIEVLQGKEYEKEIEKFKLNRQEKLDKEQERLNKVAIEKEEDTLIEEIMENDVDEDLEDAGFSDLKVENITFGRVVYIVTRTFNHNVAGTLQIENFGAQDPKRIWFKPVDKRMPFFVVSREIAPKEFLESPEDYSRTFFTASITNWSAHSRLPLAQVTGKLGQMGELPIETQALLADAGVSWGDFEDSVLSDLPSTPWEIPQTEIDIRRDFRSENVFSIDPLTAKDLDDAISVKYLENGLMEVGVHIADVSHFVKPKTSLDKEAHFRATTVYLVQRAIPMLPRLLCEQLCSLNPDVDRLAFSVVWIMNTTGEIIGEPWFGKSVIRSRAKLAYEHAQAIIEGKNWSDLPHVVMSKDISFDEIKKDVLTFFGLSKHLRKKRYDNGALSIQSIKLWFALDDVGNPVKSGIYQIKDSNRLIEEFMLLANMAVAQKISSVFSDASLLRCHPPPLQKGLDRFLELASKIGYEFDVSSAGSLHESFEKIKDPIIRHTWRLLSIKVMKRAVYFNTGTQEVNLFKHYALSVPLYTHFTSPIRRYADLVVHRMLHAILQGQENPYASGDVVEIAKQCNMRKETAKSAQDASMNLYLISFLHNLSKVEDLCEFAIVTEIGNRSLDVIVPRFGIEKRVWIEDLVAENTAKGCQFDSKTMTLKVHWKKVKNPISLLESNLNELSVEDQKKNEVIAVEDDKDDNWEDIKEGETTPDFEVQSIRMFDTIKVRIKPQLERSPPTLQLLLLYPTDTYSTNEIFSVVEDIFFIKAKNDNSTLQSVASCPGMADDRD